MAIKIKKVFSCEKCQHVFHRLIPIKAKKKNTSCPKCKARFNKDNNLVVGSERDAYLKQVLLKKKEKHLQIISRHGLRDMISMDGIKTSQIPVSLSEAQFKDKAINRGYIVHRPSWPDFILEKDNQLYFVEVKSNKDSVSNTQKETFNLLERHGHKIFLWKNNKDYKGKLVKWNQGDAKFRTE